MAGGITIALVIAAFAYYHASRPFTGYHKPLPAVPTHVPSFGRVRYCQHWESELRFDRCLRLKLHPALILRGGPAYSRSLGYRTKVR